jgi:hypothetical protein
LRLTVGQSVSLVVELHLGLMTRYLLLFLTVTVLILWDERTGLSFVHAAGPRQRSLSRVRVPWMSRPYFTVSVLRLPFSSPPTTRRVTLEVFDPASTRVSQSAGLGSLPYSLGADLTENIASNNFYVVMDDCLVIARISLTCLPIATKQGISFSRSLHSNNTTRYNMVLQHEIDGIFVCVDLVVSHASESVSYCIESSMLAGSNGSY